MNHILVTCLTIALALAGARVCADEAPAGPAAAGVPAGQAQPESPGAQPGAAPAAAPEKPALQPPGSIYAEAFDKVVETARNGWMEDPLRHLEGDMSHCVGELTALKTDRPVQQRQDQIATRLDAVIKQLEKECSGGGGGGGGDKPLGRSILAKGPGGQGDMHDPKAGDKQWASLPPKQREQILQSRTEGFPPGFESLLQSYYQRLAQEQVDEPGAAAGEASAPPATDDQEAPAGGGAQ